VDVKFWRRLKLHRQILQLGSTSPNDNGANQAYAPRTTRRRAPVEPLVFGDAEKMAKYRAVAILALALPKIEFEALAESVRASTEREPYLPVFLTDAIDLGPLRERSLFFEYLPAKPPAGYSSDSYQAVLLARLAIWRRKWCFSRIVTAGAAARRQFEFWRASPDLDLGLLELFTAEEAGDR
jgi:hypothetical protein